ncbi:MAG TPA: hypothetical protein VNZ57_13180 [Longimicrobiales bacterium]|nr:hypothetical protein [Longimicrobiales bacterium]
MLFTSDSIWTMAHGIALGGGGMLGLAAVLFYLWSWSVGSGVRPTERQATMFAGLNVAIAALLWATVIVGTFVVFPIYRLPPPEGVVDLAQHPRAFLVGDPELAWLHTFAMESKEHVPWITAMLASAIAFVTLRNPPQVFADRGRFRMIAALTVICFVLVSEMALLGVFVNKVAPVQ